MAALHFMVMAIAVTAVTVMAQDEASAKPTPVKKFGRSSFPAGFVFGAASAAFQVLVYMLHIFSTLLCEV